jgi:penicillin-binding protein 1A
MLAGLPKGPNQYDPYHHPAAAKHRRNTVLFLMAEQHLISREQMETYQRMRIRLRPSPHGIHGLPKK